jgi:hypothetical protein
MLVNIVLCCSLLIWNRVGLQKKIWTLGAKMSEFESCFFHFLAGRMCYLLYLSWAFFPHLVRSNFSVSLNTCWVPWMKQCTFQEHITLFWTWQMPISHIMRKNIPLGAERKTWFTVTFGRTASTLLFTFHSTFFLWIQQPS